MRPPYGRKSAEYRERARQIVAARARLGGRMRVQALEIQELGHQPKLPLVHVIARREPEKERRNVELLGHVEVEA